MGNGNQKPTILAKMVLAITTIHIVFKELPSAALSTFFERTNLFKTTSVIIQLR